MTATITRVGLIGLGDQSGPIAEAIGRRGFELHVWAWRSASLEKDMHHFADAMRAAALRWVLAHRPGSATTDEIGGRSPRPGSPSITTAEMTGNNKTFTRSGRSLR